MKKLHLPILSILILLGISSCIDPPLQADFEDLISKTIYDYIVENDSLYSDYLSILISADLDKTLSAYNPDGQGYTLFLPDNEAIQEFVAKSELYTNLDDLLADTAFTSSFARYHVVNIAINANDFPFGALPDLTLSQDFLTVSIIIEPDTTYFKINNQAPVVKENIEMANGFIHILGKALDPITFSNYDWLVANQGFSIFTAAVEATGFEEILDRDIRDEDNPTTPITLLLEHDSIYGKRGINSFEDLVNYLDPLNSDYESPENLVNRFVGYHIIDAGVFLLDFEGQTTNYSTFSELPVNVNGLGLDLAINKTKQIFDTIISGMDTTFIDFVGFNYDASNVITTSGAIHIIDQILERQKPTPAIVTFQFLEEALISEYRQEPGEYIIEDTALLNYLTWEGPDLTYIKSGDADHPAWSQDYLLLEGDFTIGYEIPKVVQGNYTVILRAEAFGAENALVELFIDGKKIGGLIDLSNIGTSAWPYQSIELGTIDFGNYESHLVEVKSLIPGRFCWDMIRFEPLTD